MWQNASWAVRYLRREKFKVGIFNSMFFRCLIKVEINLLDQKEGITLQMLCVCNRGGAIQSQSLKVTLSAFYTILKLYFTFLCKLKTISTCLCTRSNGLFWLFSYSITLFCKLIWFILSVQIRLGVISRRLGQIQFISFMLTLIFKTFSENGIPKTNHFCPDVQQCGSKMLDDVVTLFIW